jgi:uncharacterized protein YndB with AHSA1/START domain
MKGINPMATETKKLDFSVTRTFNAPIDQVWRAWSESDLVKRWWGPTGFTCPIADMDFREGGTSLICMRAPQEYGGQELYNTWSYRQIVPLERIEFDMGFVDKDGNRHRPADLGLPPDIPNEVRHVITFKPLGDNRTEMTVTERGYESAQTVEMSKAGLEQCLDKMAALFAK